MPTWDNVVALALDLPEVEESKWYGTPGLKAGWTFGMALLGPASGSIASSVGQLVGDSTASRRFIAQLGGPGTLVDAYLATIAGTVALIVSGYAISAVQLLRKEESAG